MATSATRGGPEVTWTREKIIESLRRYAELYGPDFTTAAFNPATARWRDREDLAERYLAGDPAGGHWPSLNVIKSRFGGFNAAREAAGLEPNKPGPASGRRPRGEHAPIRDARVDTRVIYRDRKEDPEAVARLERKVARLEARLAERPRVETRTKTTVKTKTVRVADERAVARVRAQAEKAHAALLRRLERAEEAVAAAKASEAEARRTAGRMASKLERAEAVAEAAELSARSMRTDADREVGELRAALARAEDRPASPVRVREVVVREESPEAAVVRDAERRAVEAERRAAVAEREAREHAAAVTGERRLLTRDELAELQKAGPAGPAVLGAALKQLAAARGGKGSLRDSLTAVASAAVSWRERLR